VGAFPRAHRALSPGRPDSGSLVLAAARGGIGRVAAMTAKEFFDSLETRADASKTAGMTNSYLFDIEGAGTWTVSVADGKVSVTEGGEDADAVITTSQETFEKIVSGEQNPTSAYMTGKLKVKGDMGAAMKLQKLF
jgi:putative sterol carrier protein